jgi:hypothetical protein
MSAVSTTCAGGRARTASRVRKVSRDFQRVARSFPFLIGRARGVTSLSIALPPSISATRKSYSAWRTSQSIASPPKYRANLRAVSAVTPRLPRTMSLIRAGVTPTAFAVEVGFRPAGSMKSLRRISPGWTGCAALLLMNGLTSFCSVAPLPKLEHSRFLSYIGIRYDGAASYSPRMICGKASSRWLAGYVAIVGSANACLGA